MPDDPPVAHPNRIRLTTGVLMVWIFALAVALGFLKGDVVDWIPQNAVGWLLMDRLLDALEEFLEFSDVEFGVVRNGN